MLINKITVVTGAPCSGKSTYVSEHSAAGDVIIDYDVLAQAFGSDVAHDTSGAIRKVALNAREEAIKTILQGIESPAWVIHTTPREDWLKAYRDADVVFHTMETTEKECLDRAAADGRPEGTEAAIKDWYLNQTTNKSNRDKPMAVKKMILAFDSKSFALDESDERKFSGYANTFDHQDRAGDITQRGAFIKSIAKHAEAGTKVKMLAHHDTTRPIGVWTAMREDEKGLFVEGRLTKGVRDSDEAYALLKDGALDAMSIGYRVVREEYDRKSGANLLHEIDLHEISLVAIPANQESVVTAVKSDHDIRSLERVLRDAGVSRKDAKAILAKGFNGMDEARDAPKIDSNNVDVEAQVELKRMLSIINGK